MYDPEREGHTERNGDPMLKVNVGMNVYDIYKGGVYEIEMDTCHNVPVIKFYNWDENDEKPKLQYIARFAVDANRMYPSYENICRLFAGATSKKFNFQFCEIFCLSNGEKMSIYRSNDNIQISIKDPLFGQVYSGTGYFNNKELRVFNTKR